VFISVAQPLTRKVNVANSRDAEQNTIFSQAAPQYAACLEL
jgi:hypothetical protein